MTADFIVVGGGIIGITIATALKTKFAGASVMLLEKEPLLGAHASGRNSGVLHAGFYYSSDSLKARFCRDGNRRLTQYCEDRGLPINRCGKLVVARDSADLAGLAELEGRATINAVPIERVTIEEMRKIEPRARSVGSALFSPTTASVDPHQVVAALASDARAAGVELRTGVAYLGRRNGAIVTSDGAAQSGYVVNTAGLYADVVAHDFGFGDRYRILPFKGLYLYAAPGETLRTNVYPVPDLRNPFAGVHFTVTVGGRVKIGPTATPALWREQYGWRGFRAGEMAQVVARELALFARNEFGFRELALKEIRKYRKASLVRMAAKLVSGVTPAVYRTWGRPGIRAQLLDLRSHRLVMDFVTEGDDRSYHVLNAVSPAFTCALPFADYVVDRVGELIR